jgi:hypothetical protein
MQIRLDPAFEAIIRKAGARYLLVLWSIDIVNSDARRKRARVMGHHD